MSEPPRDSSPLPTLDYGQVSIKSERHGDNAPHRRGVLDVYLRDDDTLDFKIRDPATTQGLWNTDSPA